MNHQHDPRSLAAVHPATGGSVSASGPAVSGAVLSDMLAVGLLQPVDGTSIDSFLAGQGLRVLFFPGGNSHRRDAHDVAVALSLWATALLGVSLGAPGEPGEATGPEDV